MSIVLSTAQFKYLCRTTSTISRVNLKWSANLLHLNSIQKLSKMKKYIFCMTAHTPIEKQSNKGWNTPIYLKNNGQSINDINVPLIFWFLTMTFNLCFYYQLWVKWVCIHIGNSSGLIGKTQSWFLKCLWMFDTEWNAYRIGILYNLFD